MLEVPPFEKRRVFTVAEVTQDIRALLSDHFAGLWITGEVSGVRPSSTGHLYFTLKDQEATISCVVWRQQALRLKSSLESGTQYQIYGRLDVYPPQGKYQFVVDIIESAGAGALALKFEKLKAKLSAEGLFIADRKRSLPMLPRCIGIVTASTGAALQDIIHVTRSRFPGMNLLLSPSLVQGSGAPRHIVRALERLYGACDAYAVDVIIVGRGGGSVEDLWAFNDEDVVRQVARSPVPIVSAVGHETDFTLTDFAADQRAPTPSAAAAMVVPKEEDLRMQVGHYQYTVSRLMNNHLVSARKSLDASWARLKSSAPTLQGLQWKLQHYKFLLYASLRQRLTQSERVLSLLSHRSKQGKEVIDRMHGLWSELQKRLMIQNPADKVVRGWMYVQGPRGVVSSVNDVSVGDNLQAWVGDGWIELKVLTVTQSKE
jgi:exodeoxyribonuclease VII large subunit